jgi:hypothetical protein
MCGSGGDDGSTSNAYVAQRLATAQLHQAALRRPLLGRSKFASFEFSVFWRRLLELNRRVKLRRVAFVWITHPHEGEGGDRHHAKMATYAAARPKLRTTGAPYTFFRASI